MNKLQDLKHTVNQAYTQMKHAHNQVEFNRAERIFKVAIREHDLEIHRLKNGYYEREALTAEMERRGMTRETCSECFGTGHRFGFGAPCSKGCEVMS